MIFSARTQALAEAQNWRCAYCSFVMLAPWAGNGELRAVIGRGQSGTHRRKARIMRTISCDHVEPRSAHGTDALDNLVAACCWCNQFRGDRPAAEAFNRIQRLIRRGTHPHQVWERTGRFPSYVAMRQVGQLRQAPREVA
ncbi:hypothetical protein DK419_13445 [Methylobacterium terrae]|uniref:HNH domain-containing protein n=1 Tax=Methylobacterium terrae TaxID=2202827 RepID=A0A2U8WNW2_9HYPH|nr:HNH endonuclease signature motif containing protein [Methylobacterium terrae]AWN47198.1 hypothetical protein DK419_13445 [Methylobacterium terrae]